VGLLICRNFLLVGERLGKILIDQMFREVKSLTVELRADDVA
jgi:hypothetical protein